MTVRLSQYFSFNRRFSRSVNLERDLEQPEAVQGYIPTDKAGATLQQILSSILRGDATRAWTITGVYGTGKSAFAHFLVSLCSSRKSAVRQEALKIVHDSALLEQIGFQKLISRIPDKGYVRAVVTAQQEPLSHTITRALDVGISSFWKAGRDRNQVAPELVEMLGAVADGKKINSRKLLTVIRKIARAAGVPVVLIVDELGKTLEYAIQHQDSDDLYLLQQLAELPKEAEAQIYFVGLLHQSFADYARRLTSAERNEWAKIQGRFASIVFRESPQQMIQLMSRAIIPSVTRKLGKQISTYAAEWYQEIFNEPGTGNITQEILEAVYPLHPLSALVLPELCIDYAQNDRSLFTFLTGSEPYSFQNFLSEAAVAESLPTLKLDQLYDYFVEAIGIGMAAMPNLQRWLEIQERIAYARYSDSNTQQNLDAQRMLKAIGLLNLAGGLRATRSRVILAMCDEPRDEKNHKRWEGVLNYLVEKRAVVEYKELDEIRLWRGSEFDIEGELSKVVAQQQMASLAVLLKAAYPLKPLVAQRHSYETGTLRYFERHYIENLDDLNKLHCLRPDSDGIVGYWIGEKPLTRASNITVDGKPFVIVSSAQVDVLRTRAVEFSALTKMLEGIPQLQIDKVAQREVQYRLVQAEELLRETLNRLFNPANPQTTCWVGGQRRNLAHTIALNEVLSQLCDSAYKECLVLRNELINRRKLTSQGATAQGELLKAMLKAPHQERLGLTGNGPAVTMYESVLRKTGIHRQSSTLQEEIALEQWGFHPPTDETVLRVWKKIDSFCSEANNKPKSLELLYQNLEAPPFGIKKGVIPVLLAAVLLHRTDDVSVYKDGTFIPVLGPEHFELLVKDPTYFSVKYVQMDGLRMQVFRQLEELIVGKITHTSPQERNATLLSVVKRLVKFAESIHPFTRQTELTSPQAQQVLKALVRGQEPDRLLFHDLPTACGMKPLEANAENDVDVAQTLCDRLVLALRELRAAYNTHVIERGRQLLCEAFSSTAEHIREDLRSRSRTLINQCLVPQCIEKRLKHFLDAATEEHKPEQEWLEALLFVITDKPLQSWTDQEITTLQVNLSRLSKQLIHLEILQRSTALNNNEATTRITTTIDASGEEKQVISVLKHQDKSTIAQKLENLLNNDKELRGNLDWQKAFVAEWLDAIHKAELQAEQEADRLAQQRAKHQGEKKSQRKQPRRNRR
jgi:hypothetical protein